MFSSICLSSFYLFQFHSNFLKYSSSNLLSSHPYNNFAMYFPSNSILLYSILSTFLFSTCHLTSTSNLSSKSFTSFFVFLKSSSFSHVSFSAVNPFHWTKYFSTPLIFLLFKIFSTSYSSTPLTSTGFPFFFFCPFTCSLYLTTQLTLTTRWILIEFGNCNFTAFNNITSFISYCPTYLLLTCTLVKIVDGGLCFYFPFSFIWFLLSFYFFFLFLEQLGLGFVSHAVTSVTNWWRSHKTDHETWENEVEGTRIKWRHTAWTTHAGLM